MTADKIVFQDEFDNACVGYVQSLLLQGRLAYDPQAGKVIELPMRTVVEEGVKVQRGVLLYDRDNNLWFMVDETEVAPATGVQSVWMHRINAPVGEGQIHVPASWVKHMERFVAERDRTPVGVCTNCGQIIWKDMVKEP